jgi:RNA 2',3'-cyclic 3'-phosphodiesterase
VAKERLKSPRARLFVALDLPDAIRAGLAAWQRKELGDPALRPVSEQALHITLCFLSYHPEKAIDRIAGIVTGVDPRPVELRFEREPAAVPRGRPRLFALDAPSEAAVSLQAELEQDLVAARFYKPEKRPFWSHVTVARVRSERLPPKRGERRGRGRPKRVAAPPGPLPARLTKPFGAVRLALYRSNLKPSGAEYVSLAALNLPPPARAEATEEVIAEDE